MKILLLLILILIGCSKGVKTVPEMSFQGNTMGTYYRIKIIGNIPLEDRPKLQEIIDRKLHHVNHLMSTYIPTSQISQFNQAQTTHPFKIHKSFKQVVEQALEIYQKSNKAFDITVMPLVRLWGFGPDGPQNIPSDQKVIEVKQYVGSDKLVVIDGKNSIKKNHPKLQIDLSAIAKGYGVDVLSKDLNWAHPLKGSLVEIGGEVVARGVKADGTNWKVGIEAPSKEAREGIGKKLNKVIKLKDLAIATSGSYRNFFESGGKRYSHTLDVSTGKPIRHGLVSVSVISKTCLEADAWATALMASGPEKAEKLAAKHNLLAYFIIKSEKGVIEKASPSMMEYLNQNEVK